MLGCQGDPHVLSRALESSSETIPTLFNCISRVQPPQARTGIDPSFTLGSTPGVSLPKDFPSGLDTVKRWVRPQIFPFSVTLWMVSYFLVTGFEDDMVSVCAHLTPPVLTFCFSFII